MSKKLNLIPGKHLASFALVGNVPEGTCPECAVKHEPFMPHDRESLFYQYKFYNEHGRWPSWEDAMEHCPEEFKVVARETLASLGITSDDRKKGAVLDA
jgi:hypothetical protein